MIYKEAGQEKKSGKGGSGSALSKENAWTEWGVEYGREMNRFETEYVSRTIYKN